MRIVASPTELHQDREQGNRVGDFKIPFFETELKEAERFARGPSMLDLSMGGHWSPANAD